MSSLPRTLGREAIRADISASTHTSYRNTYIDNSNEQPASTDSDPGGNASVNVVVDTNDGKDDGDSSDHS